MTNWKAVAGVLLIFLMGVLLGASLSHYFGKRVLQHALRGPDEFSFFWVGRLTKILYLDSEQEAKLIQVVKKSRKKMKTVRREVEPRVKIIFEEAEAEISAFLSQDQKAMFQKMIQKRRQFFQEFKQRRPRPERGEFSEPPEPRDPGL